MKAKTAVLTAVETAEVIDRELPELGEHDVLVKIDANNICTSEYGAFNGARKRPLPLVFGHEWAGTVVEVGSAVDSVAVGDYIASGYQYDPYSEPSREGRTSECTKLQSADHPNPDGYFGNAGCANYAVPKQAACYKIDKGIDPSVAALLEPLGTCCAGFRRFGIEYGQTVVVIGAGTMGVLNALVAKAHGCRDIITEMMPKKLETAAKLGLETIDVSKCNPVEKVRELTGGKGADGVIIAVGASGAYAQALEMAKEKRAHLLIFAAGYPAPKWELDPNTVHYRRMVIVGSYGADAVDFREAASMINMGAADFSQLVEEKIPLDKIQEAFEEACKPGMYRISVQCQED